VNEAQERDRKTSRQLNVTEKRTGVSLIKRKTSGRERVFYLAGKSELWGIMWKGEGRVGDRSDQAAWKRG